MIMQCYRDTTKSYLWKGTCVSCASVLHSVDDKPLGHTKSYEHESARLSLRELITDPTHIACAITCTDVVDLCIYTSARASICPPCNRDPRCFTCVRIVKVRAPDARGCRSYVSERSRWNIDETQSARLQPIVSVIHSGRPHSSEFHVCFTL